MSICRPLAATRFLTAVALAVALPCQKAEDATIRSPASWEEHLGDAKSRMSDGQYGRARESMARAKQLLTSRLAEVETLEEQLRQRAGQMCDEAEAAIRAEDFDKAKERLTEANHTCPGLPRIAALNAQLPVPISPDLLGPQSLPVKKKTREQFLEGLERIRVNKEPILGRIERAKSVDEVIQLISELDLGSDPKIDAIRQVNDLTQAKATSKQLVVSAAASRPEADVAAAKASLEAGNFEAVLDGMRSIRGNPYYAEEEWTLIAAVAKTRPDLAVPFLVEIYGHGGEKSEAANKLLNEIYTRDALRHERALPALRKAVEQKDPNRIVAMIDAGGGLAHPSYPNAKNLLNQGRSDEALAELTAIVENLATLLTDGIKPESAPKEGRPFVASCGMPLRFVPAAAVAVGSSRAQVDQPFWISERWVRRGEWLHVMGTDRPAIGGSRKPDDDIDTGVTAWQASAYCDLMTQLDRAAGRLPEGFRYALPTAAQLNLALSSEPGRLELPAFTRLLCLDDTGRPFLRNKDGTNPERVSPNFLHYLHFRFVLVPGSS
jgi:hypothetical protein